MINFFDIYLKNKLKFKLIKSLGKEKVIHDIWYTLCAFIFGAKNEFVYDSRKTFNSFL